MSQRRFFLLSVTLHLILSVWVFIGAKPPQKDETVSIEIVERPKVASEKDASKIKKALHIVDQADKALNDEIPDDAKFLSKNNQVVKKQSVAKNHGEFQNMKKAGSPSLTVNDLQPQMDVAKLAREQSRRDQMVEDGSLPRPKPVERKIASEDAQLQKPQQNSGGQVSQSLEYIKNIDTGLETILSTKEFVFYTYFSRIRKQLNQYWGAKVKEKVAQIYKAGRSIASSDDKITHCLITLDPQGNLLKVQVIGDSGIQELDEAAVEAFHAAQPFPNPPKGIIDPDGNIKIRWDFILEA